ncbi:hypothetical protein QN382_06790 [Pseudomonas sp. 10B1]|nr:MULTISPECIES: hypothetical protein [unclassified Pseudomonas]MDY7560938.1 hypothetical protein [Pseudomonas sp. AB6]MEA9995133.1 hypothetical protein [Pseudomonas sp. AA4]MEB0086983.1 hypothetical protein [Pseudomonas sp. RTI1]MEB0126750.1 hypothetical protein [Pseudomonas sp. CCC1.2]MEB0152402.1 hypothetical protein [Pseudomonas sp. CCC4.3]
MIQTTKRSGTTQTPKEVGDVGEHNKKLNQQGEKPRPATPPDPKDLSST